MAIIFAILAILLLAISLLNKLIVPKEERREVSNKEVSLKLQPEEEKEMIALFSALCSWLSNLEGVTGKYTLQLGSKKRDLQIEYLDDNHGVIRVNGKRLEVRFMRES